MESISSKMPSNIRSEPVRKRPSLSKSKKRLTKSELEQEKDELRKKSSENRSFNFNIGKIGEGSYGETSVIRKNNRFFVTKKFRNIGRDVFYEQSIYNSMKGYYKLKKNVASIADDDQRFSIDIPVFGNAKTLMDFNNLSIDKMRDILFDIFLGLEHLRQAGFVHGDIKPPNIVVNTRLNKTYLIDFGLADVIGVRAYMNQVTLGFNSPQALVDPSNETGLIANTDKDVYAVGRMIIFLLDRVILYEEEISELFGFWLDTMNVDKTTANQIIDGTHPLYDTAYKQLRMVKRQIVQKWKCKKIAEDKQLLDLVARLQIPTIKWRLTSYTKILNHPFFKREYKKRILEKKIEMVPTYSKTLPNIIYYMDRSKHYGDGYFFDHVYPIFNHLSRINSKRASNIKRSLDLSFYHFYTILKINPKAVKDHMVLFVISSFIIGSEYHIKIYDTLDLANTYSAHIIETINYMLEKIPIPCLRTLNDGE